LDTIVHKVLGPRNFKEKFKILFYFRLVGVGWVLGVLLGERGVVLEKKERKGWTLNMMSKQ
jgi:hypothetical protein